MQPISVTVGPITTGDDNLIATAQPVASPSDLALTASVVVLDAPRQVIITSSGNDASVHFTIYGTTFGGHAVSETVTGVDSGAVATVTDFKTVTRVYADAPTDGNVIVGTNGVAGSRWVRLDNWAFAQTAVQVNVNGTADFTIQTTLDDPNDPISPINVSDVNWLDALDANLVTTAVNTSGYIAYTPSYVRVLLNSGSGSVTSTFSQAGNVPL